MPRRKNIGENGQFSQSIEHNLYNVQLVDKRKPAPKYLLKHENQAVLEASWQVPAITRSLRLVHHHGLGGFRDRAHPDARLPPQCAEGLRPPGERAPQRFFRWRHAAGRGRGRGDPRVGEEARRRAGPDAFPRATTAASAGRCCTT